LRDRRELATELAALPPRTGFRRPFTIRARGWVARPARGEAVGPDASRRLLQPEQSTSTTTGPPDPRFERAGTTGPACAGLGGDLPDGVEAPSAAPNAESRQPPGSASLRSLRTVDGMPPPGAGRGFTGQGPCSVAARRLASLRAAWAALGPRVNAGSEDGASPQPDPLGHLSSRNRGRIGWRLRCKGAAGRSRTWRHRRSRRTRPALAREREGVGPVWPLQEPALARLAGRVRRRVPRLRGAHGHARHGSRQSACAVPTRPLAEGRFTRCSAKRIGIRRHPRCLPSTSRLTGDAQAFARDARLAPCFVRGTGRFPQVVTNLWKTHGASCNLRRDRAALTSRPAAKDRSPWWLGSGGACKAAWIEPKLAPSTHGG